ERSTRRRREPARERGRRMTAAQDAVTTDRRGTRGMTLPRQSTSGGRGQVIGYITVHQGTAWELEDAASVIRRACENADWGLVELVTDRDCGRRSPGL